MEEGIPAHEMLSSIAYQLLSLKPDMLGERKRFEELKAAIEDEAWRAENISPVCKVLSTILRELKTVYVILDRVDRCMCRGNVRRLIHELVEAGEQEGCSVKTLVITAPTGMGHVEIDVPDELVEKKRYLEMVGWNQEYVTPRPKRFY